MTAARGWPSTTPRPLRLALVQLGVAIAVFSALLVAVVVVEAPEAIWLYLLTVLVVWAFVAAGLLAWSRRPGNRFGALTVGMGLGILVSNVGATALPPLVVVSAVLGSVPLALLVHLLHAFPSGRLTSRRSWVVVVGGYVVSLGLQAPLYLFAAAPPPYDVLTVADRPDLVALGVGVQAVAGSAVMIATVVILAGRLRRADRRRRRALAPLYGYGMLVVLSIPLGANVLGTLLQLSPTTISVMQHVTVAGIPIAFTLALLRGGFARTVEIEELGSWLSTAESGRTTLGSALARALGDDSARLIFWVPERAEYVLASGDPADPGPVPERGRVEIARGGQRVGAIDYDTTLIADPAPVRSAGQVIAIAVDHERVTAELRASRQELLRSRERIVTAGDHERRRIARDLHDGLQMRLVLLALQAQQLADSHETADHTRVATTALRVGIDAAAAELRDFVHAVLPAALIERGLSAATEDLVDHLPVPTRLVLAVPEHSLTPVVESTAYFVVAEALTNAVKHARPRALEVHLTRVDGHLRVEVRDDGVGGAAVRPGSGLGGLADRVETLGGRLELTSAPGRGTRIVAELPCAS